MTLDGPRILVIEDEQEIRRFLRLSLASHGYQVVESMTGGNGLLQASAQQPDLLIVDLGLPDMEGRELIQQVRQWSAVPIIVLSARGDEAEKIRALDAGADDYLTKPFGVGELLARIRVALRRQDQAARDAAPLNYAVDRFRVDVSRRQVHVDEREVHLTPTEFRLVAMLVRHAGRVVTHRQLLTEVWGPASLEDTHALRVYMARLRGKIEAEPARPRYLLTEPGIGYRLAAE
ncbi:MAG TPA: response regulator [Pirellulales bacterium]